MDKNQIFGQLRRGGLPCWFIYKKAVLESNACMSRLVFLRFSTSKKKTWAHTHKKKIDRRWILVKCREANFKNKVLKVCFYTNYALSIRTLMTSRFRNFEFLFFLLVACNGNLTRLQITILIVCFASFFFVYLFGLARDKEIFFLQWGLWVTVKKKLSVSFCDVSLMSHDAHALWTVNVISNVKPYLQYNLIAKLTINNFFFFQGFEIGI